MIFIILFINLLIQWYRIFLTTKITIVNKDYNNDYPITIVSNANTIPSITKMVPYHDYNHPIVLGIPFSFAFNRRSPSQMMPPRCCWRASRRGPRCTPPPQKKTVDGELMVNLMVNQGTHGDIVDGDETNVMVMKPGGLWWFMVIDDDLTIKHMGIPLMNGDLTIIYWVLTMKHRGILT